MFSSYLLEETESLL